MRLVAFSTSSPVGSAALAQAGTVVASRAFSAGLVHGRALLSVLAELFGAAGWARASFDAVAVDIGPGSYTGCRVGLICAKILAVRTKGALVGIPSLDCIALRAQEWAALEPGQASKRSIACVLDARREAVYAATYRLPSQAHPGAPAPLPERTAGPMLAPAAGWASAPRADLWAGDALARYPEAFGNAARVPQALWTPDAAAVARLGAARLDRGERDDPYTLQPLYLRPSGAQEKAAQEQGRGDGV